MPESLFCAAVIHAYFANALSAIVKTDMKCLLIRADLVELHAC
jgi:hypothetical protein